MAEHGGNNEFEALARKYWSQWGETLRAGATSTAGFPGAHAAGAGAALPGWTEALSWWSQMARDNGAGLGAGMNAGFNPQADAMVDHFTTQAQSWYARMQQLAVQFAGQDASASDIAAAWKRALGGDLGNPFADVLRDMQGPGQQGFEHWLAQAMPFIDSMQRQGQSWLGMPAFGFTREHQQRWQQLAQAQANYQQHTKAYQALMAQAAQDAFKRFEDKLGEHSASGKQLESARALFDLWIDAAEDAYADIALSPRFREAYGAMVNAQMGLRAAVQEQIEQLGQALGVPTRSEVDAAHRKIVQLERQVRQLRDLVGQGLSPSPSTRKPPAKKAAAKKAVVKKTATKKTATKKTTTSKRALGAKSAAGSKSKKKVG